MRRQRWEGRERPWLELSVVTLSLVKSQVRVEAGLGCPCEDASQIDHVSERAIGSSGFERADSLATVLAKVLAGSHGRGGRQRQGNVHGAGEQRVKVAGVSARRRWKGQAFCPRRVMDLTVFGDPPTLADRVDGRA